MVTVTEYERIQGAAQTKVDADNVLDTAKFPTLSTGTAAPTTTPTKVGDMFVDTTNKKLYFAVATIADTDWIIAN